MVIVEYSELCCAVTWVTGGEKTATLQVTLSLP